MKIALAQINPTIGDLSGNALKIEEFFAKARDQGAKLVVFPELSLCGYPPRDLLLRRDFLAEMRETYVKLRRKLKGAAVILGLACQQAEDPLLPLLNTAVCFKDGEEIARYAKNLLPSYDVYDEPRYFEGPQRVSVFKLDGWALGLTICEDIWNLPGFTPYRYRFDPVSTLAQEGAQVVVNISASPFHVDKGELRKRLLSLQARKNNVFILYCNQVGANDHLIFDGHSLAFHPQGNLLAEARDFEETVLVFDLDQKPILQPVSQRREESLLKALVLGVKDYFRKTGFKGALVGLSGGIDSSVTAAIAQKALGAAQVLGVLMPSPYTSRESVEDAQKLAQNLGLKTLTVPISQPFGTLKKELQKALGKEPKGLTQENLQARLRGNILMALANEFGYLVLNTGNKSELAVGYCTLYGDTCGAISVLGDVIKTDVYALAREINREGEIIPERVLEKPPSAELRPGQKDEDDLPPYRLLDQVVRGFVEEGQTFEELVDRGLPEETVREVLRRLRIEEYKRWQFPPTLRVSPQAFGYGWRYPIAQRFFFHRQ